MPETEPMGSTSDKRPSVCLAMIVKNEAAVIDRCIRSVKGLVDSWVICDTGSSDGTQARVRALLSDIPGHLHKRPWRDFGHNRTELLTLARRSKSDYLLLLDADITAEAETGALDHLDADSYLVPVVGSTLTYWMPYLVRSSLPWRYEGSTHEYITTDVPYRSEQIKGLTLRHHADGGSRHDKFERDRALLTADLDRDPDNPRTVFYLAQTYRDMGDRPMAMKLYRRRATMGGWEEEVYYAKYQAAQLLAAENWNIGVEALLEAWDLRPTRAEPLYDLATGFRQRDLNHLAYLFADRGMTIEEPNDTLFVSSWIYRWGLRFERSVAAYWIGRHREALHDCDVLSAMDIPEPWRSHVTENRSYSLKALGP